MRRTDGLCQTLPPLDERVGAVEELWIASDRPRGGNFPAADSFTRLIPRRPGSGRSYLCSSGDVHAHSVRLVRFTCRSDSTGWSPRGTIQPTIYRLTHEALEIVDEWLTWFLQGRLPKDGVLSFLRSELSNL
jgi:hypothetical protein